ncbi:aminotransferase class V-fold PLP-dependent enzyme [Silvibacterium dinghuense]|uniref:Aminotransferase class V-fold PLP-dependent enzyme n=1 Tax=Silvibacterium dinghuense TaxID=1560006 RepID=A0A4Q1SE85_9BACT|nr:aminotransferase class V-fold PLP-dependent enzyme [Silvibacterium dinghuense]RXS95238.1 aminotransferase class V-fold PLP-dependent enzyme [Silvibacterium dinghuense]GGH11733.1 kynureninase [Silvibacterium dinghuense]
MSRIAQAVAAFAGRPLEEGLIQRHLAPLFSRVLASDRIYLANHSLGRPLDAMADDLAEAVSVWYRGLDEAWAPWLAEQEAFRARIARMIHAPRPDCIVPKASAGQGLRTVLNALPGRLRVLTTRGEFDSIDVILRQYAAMGEIELRWIDADSEGSYHVDALIAALEAGVDLVVVSMVMFMTGQLLDGLEKLAVACHRHEARLLVDAYHAVGVVPVDVQQLGADFLIGGSYKYLRGGPGACYLYLSPQVMGEGLKPLDIGWFAKEETFAYERPDPPLLKQGGDGFLESTPPVFTYYQARSGQEFVQAMGIERLRAYSLQQLALLRGLLDAEGIGPMRGGDGAHGAFLSIYAKDAKAWVQALEREGIVCDARGPWLRLCPDCLTREEEMRTAAKALGRLRRSTM